MIRFLNPGFAWMLAAPAAIVVLYLLRRRFLPQQVPSVFLWRRSVQDYAANDVKAANPRAAGGGRNHRDHRRG